MNILLIIKVKILVLIEGSYKSSPIMLTLEIRMVIVFWIWCPISFKHMSLLYLFLKPLEAHTTQV